MMPAIHVRHRLRPALSGLGALALTLLIAACDSGSGGSGGPTSTDQEFAANTTTALDQQRPAVASNRAGRSVVAWESFGQDGSHLGIVARRFDNGAPIGPEFVVNTYTVGRQNFPAVAMDAAGNFVVAWRSSLQGSPGGTIFAQRYAADGSKLGGEFRVGPDNSNRDSQSEPQVAMNAQGDFAIAWSNREVGALAEALGRNGDEDRWIEVRTYTADGNPRIAPKRTTVQADDPFPRAPRIGMDANGNIAVVWASAAGGTQLRVQHYDSSANALSPVYNINEISNEIDADLATMAMAPDGSFAVAWETYTFGYQPLGLLVRRYSGPQSPVGPPQRVAPPESGLVERNSMAITANGDLLLTAHATDRVYFAVLTADGALIGPTRVSNSGFASLFPSVAQSGPNRALVAWQSLGQDGDGRGIRVREISLR
ncbi:MAG TPA: hypothetical protein VGE57_05520 [Solimonas sp.]